METPIDSSLSLFSLVRDIRYHITHADTEKALALALDNMQTHARLNELILQNARLRKLREATSEGHLSWEIERIEQNQINDALLKLADIIEEEERRDTHVFISYSQRDPDKRLAFTLYKSIQSKGFQVFIAGEDMIAGQNWAKRILTEIRLCDFFIVLLSPDSNESEMVLAEVRQAKKLQEVHPKKKPHLLPIRVNLPESFQLNYDLHGYLKNIHYLKWNKEAETTQLIRTLERVLKQEKEIAEVGQLISDNEVVEFLSETSRKKPLPVASLEKVGGAMMPDSPFYISRKGEMEFRSLIEQPAAILRIKGPRQYGKTSLLSKILSEAYKHKNFLTAHLSFQLLDRDALCKLENLCWQFCLRICKETGKLRELRSELKELWDDDLFTVKEKCTTFMEEILLPSLDAPLIVGLDEVDIIFKYHEVSNNFFAMLRAWHDSATLPRKEMWKNFRLVLSYSTEIHLAIKNLDQSPFNVGHEREMKPFNGAEIRKLVELHGLENSALPEELLSLMGGYPYLSRKALYLLGTQAYNLERLKEIAPKDNGPFSDHLRHHLMLLQGDEACAKAMKAIVQGHEFHDKLTVSRLRAAGLIKGASPVLQPAHDLYLRYFKSTL